MCPFPPAVEQPQTPGLLMGDNLLLMRQVDEVQHARFAGNSPDKPFAVLVQLRLSSIIVIGASCRSHMAMVVQVCAGDFRDLGLAIQ